MAWLLVGACLWPTFTHCSGEITGGKHMKNAGGPDSLCLTETLRIVFVYLVMFSFTFI